MLGGHFVEGAAVGEGEEGGSGGGGKRAAQISNGGGGDEEGQPGGELKYSRALSGGEMVRVVSTRVWASGELGPLRSDSSLRSEGE